MTRLFHVDMSCHPFLPIILSVSVAHPQHVLYIHKKKRILWPSPFYFLSFYTFACCRSKWFISLAGRAWASRAFSFIAVSLASSWRAEIWTSSTSTSNLSLSFRLPGKTKKNCRAVVHSPRSQSMHRTVFTACYALAQAEDHPEE